ncbi:phosphoribosyltransferase [Simkania negevensis]|uniref:Hypoxanthine-guanine phosphoribosyltransferase n=1 Tax=Simkania negevensis (strain ATCC VR-1471 / DSM 27360 / Z) TaxID=331113 RepID=F8L9S3_SIMNZ|nr:phosphoribosyltransferase family protein [Simkania negevensis]CCB89619.1 hypoxanthine-guanine phosphoribosyltransferase [Simkania negevensis Z]
MNHSFLEKKQPPGNALQLDLLIDREKIDERLRALAQELETLYKDEEITIVMLMKGAFFLVADLMRLLHLPMRVEALSCSSYGERGMQKGELIISGLEKLRAEEKHILIVDDIFDIGDTLSEVYEVLKQKKPASLRSLVLLTKDVPHQTDYRPDFSLFDIEDRFVVGYGLDYKEYYRGMPDIYAINP